MKNAILGLCLILSISALALNLSREPKQLGEAKIRELITQTVQEKERKYVEGVAPTYGKLYDLIVPGFSAENFQPQTNMELIEPLLPVINETLDSIKKESPGFREMLLNRD